MPHQAFKPTITALDFQGFGERVDCLKTMPDFPDPHEAFLQLLRIRQYVDGRPAQEPKLLVICSLSPDDLTGFWYFEEDLWTLHTFLVTCARIPPGEWHNRLRMARPVDIHYKATNLDQLVMARPLTM